ncbi:hypothetical protein HanXRQr2_Chr07g0282341 [Helianthus annuus]|uniref:Uncharacterized protein n=1 Tax=Helianthus annuus TaxID=4232 RepID=A0A9K3IIM6_HELAN|nr:hypothetical protein HanXRQr2_Chr07g0282341 [Helianthus annuus]KAJ0903715.1 hypothetical protein HanPSC8_Chr07g0273171 [Helianthus annuus]
MGESKRKLQINAIDYVAGRCSNRNANITIGWMAPTTTCFHCLSLSQASNFSEDFRVSHWTAERNESNQHHKFHRIVRLKA